MQDERSVISFFFLVYEKMSAFMMNILNICFLKPSKLVHRFSDIRAKSLHPGQCLDAGVSNKYLKMWLPVNLPKMCVVYTSNQGYSVVYKYITTTM